MVLSDRAARLLPDKLPPTASELEFAATLAKRRENNPSPRAARPRNCQLENITGCGAEDTTIKLITSNGNGALQTLGEKMIGKSPK